MDDPISVWEEKLEALQARGMTQAAGIRHLVLNEPATHRAYIEAYNQMHGRPYGLR